MRFFVVSAMKHDVRMVDFASEKEALDYVEKSMHLRSTNAYKGRDDGLIYTETSLAPERISVYARE